MRTRGRSAHEAHEKGKPLGLVFSGRKAEGVRGVAAGGAFLGDASGEVAVGVATAWARREIARTWAITRRRRAGKVAPLLGPRKGLRWISRRSRPNPRYMGPYRSALARCRSAWWPANRWFSSSRRVVAGRGPASVWGSFWEAQIAFSELKWPFWGSFWEPRSRAGGRVGRRWRARLSRDSGARALAPLKAFTRGTSTAGAACPRRVFGVRLAARGGPSLPSSAGALGRPARPCAPGFRRRAARAVSGRRRSR